MHAKSATIPEFSVVPESVGGVEAGRARPGDEAAFRGFYDRTAPQLRAYLARCSGNPSAVADLVQEAYYRLLRSGFRGAGEAHRKNYLFRIATNLLADLFRRRHGVEVAETEAPCETGLDERWNLRADMGAALRTLSPRDRQLLWLAYVEESSHREIARITGLKESSIRSMIFRARARLAAHLRERGLEPRPGGQS